MAKILLLDFDETDRAFLVSEKYDVELRATGWKSGSDAPLEIPAESDVVFYQSGAEGPEGPEDLHSDVHKELARRVEDGVRVVCFVGGGALRRLTNIVHPFSGLQLQEAARADSIVFNPRALFHVPFERFRPFLAKAFKLFPETVDEGCWERQSATNGTYEILAKSADGYPVAILLRKGKGYYLILPSFGAKNVEIIHYILKDKLSFAAGLPETTAGDWIDDEEYVFPDLRELLVKKDEERRRHEEALAVIDRQIQDMKAVGQEEFHRLLKAEGPELRKSVLHALRYIGWGKVVDVDEYWKNVIRNKEEDVWLIESNDQPVEVSMRKEDLVLVIVRGNKNWATDDECALLQKYKGRRMQEFDNTKMKAVLIGNFFSGADPKTRGNPFSSVQIEEAQKDGNGLLTTYELFRAIKAEKEGRLSKDAIRERIKLQTGLILFEA